MLAAPKVLGAPRLPFARQSKQRQHAAPVRSAPSENMSIQEYIEEHALGKKVEDVINAAVKAKAPEPISFMVRPRASCGENYCQIGHTASETDV